MFSIFQILQDSFSIKNLIRLYLTTGNKNESLYNEIQKRWMEYLKINNIYTPITSLLSLENENDITGSHYILQIRKTSSKSKVKSYSVAIHTDLTYMLFDVVKDKNEYRAYAIKTITRDLEDYQNTYQNILPSLFMEFIVSSVSVSKAFDCELLYINETHTPTLLKGEKENVCIYSNSLYVGDNGLIPTHDELS
jgi:hypothetical protein